MIDMCLKIDPAKRPTAKELLKIIDEDKMQMPKSRMSSVNLLSTIKVPKNMESWKNELPKADYETLSEKPADEILHPKFGNVSHRHSYLILRLIGPYIEKITYFLGIRSNFKSKLRLKLAAMIFLIL